MTPISVSGDEETLENERGNARAFHSHNTRFSSCSLSLSSNLSIELSPDSDSGAERVVESPSPSLSPTLSVEFRIEAEENDQDELVLVSQMSESVVILQELQESDEEDDMKEDSSEPPDWAGAQVGSSHVAAPQSLNLSDLLEGENDEQGVDHDDHPCGRKIKAKMHKGLIVGGECLVCGWETDGLKVQDVVKHYDRNHSPEDYAGEEELLKTYGIGICPIGGEARKLSKRGTICGHSCRPRVVQAQVGEVSSHNDDVGDRVEVEWSSDLPWPSGVPLPPKVILHPLHLSLPQPGSVIMRVPNHAIADWTRVVLEACSSLADAIEGNDEGKKAIALVNFLEMTNALKKSKRGGRRHKKVFGNEMTKYGDLMLERVNAGVIVPEDREVVREEGERSAVERERRMRDRLEERRRLRQNDDDDEKDEERLREVDRKMEKEKRLVKRAEVLIGAGHFSKASRLLRSTEECLPVTQDLADKMQAKFPKRRERQKVISPVTPESELYISEIGDFIKEVKEAINGSVGGRSGLRGDHLKPLVSNLEVMEALMRVMTLLINGSFPRWAHPYLFSRRLLALGAKARPICISEWVVRLAGFLVNRTVNEDQANAFFLHEDDGNVVMSVGAKVKGGGEVLVHAIDALAHDERKARAVFASDGKNAYNSVDRVYACNTTITTFPSTHRWIEYSYGNATLGLLLEGDGESFTVAEEEGVWQGDSMAGLIHDTAFHTTLIAASKQAPEERVGKPNAGELTHIIAYRDDPFITGDPATAARLHQLVCEKRSEMLGVEAAPSKFQAYLAKALYRDEGEYKTQCELVQNMTGIVVREEGIEVLKAPVGTTAFVRAFLNEKMNEYAIVLPRVCLMDPRCAVPFLRLTFLPIPTYLSRIIQPALFMPFARMHDTHIRDTYNTLMDDNIDVENTRFTAPLSVGGWASDFWSPYPPLPSMRLL